MKKDGLGRLFSFMQVSAEQSVKAALAKMHRNYSHSTVAGGLEVMS